MKPLVCLLLIAVLWFGAGELRAVDGAFETVDCPFHNLSGYPIECGMVSVPADHTRPESGTIRLAVAIIRSLNEQPASDPVLYLSGGPGGAFVWMAPLMSLQYGLDRVLAERDVILVDQRGMGLSEPRFSCPVYAHGAEVFRLSADEMQARVAACLPRFESAGFDWRIFTTEQNAADLALIPAALGYDSYNLYGTSYGSLLGLLILRDHPQGVRSAVLDSVLTPQSRPFAESAQRFAESFAAFEAVCQADSVCRVAYPDVRNTFLRTYSALNEQPALLTVNDVTVNYSGEMFADQVLRMLADRTALAELPAFIDRLSRGDDRPVLTFVEQVLATAPHRLPDQALYMTMVCPQSIHDLTRDQLRAQQAPFAQAFTAGGYGADDWQLCQAWGELPAFDTRLPQSDVPVLLLSGALDPLTPAIWADTLLDGLPQAQHIVLPDTAHVTANGACGAQLMSAFIQQPDQMLDQACVMAVPALAFVLTTGVTFPVVSLLAGVMGIGALLVTGWVLWRIVRDPRRLAWGTAFRRLGWLPLFSAVAIVLPVLSRGSVLLQDVEQLGVVQALVPLLMGLLSAAVFSAQDEASLEIELAAQRPLFWAVLERLLAVWVVMVVVACIGTILTVLIAPETDWRYVLLAWIPAGVFLSGVGVYSAIRARLIVFGVVVVGLLWFAFSLFAGFFLPGQSFPFPLNVVQAFLWAIHLHATPNDLTWTEFLVSRAFLLGSGTLLIVLALWQLRDPENVLLQTARKRGKAVKQVSASAAASGLTQDVRLRISAWAQIAAIARSEWLILWRGLALRVLMLTPILGGGVLLLIAGDLSMFFPSLSATDDASRMILNGEMLAVMSAGFLFVLGMYLYPLIVADRVPADRHLHVDEMLGALPLADAVYLAGKVCGALLATGAAALVAMVGMGVIALLHYRVIDPVAYLEIMAHVLIAQSLLVALAVLLGSIAGSSRRALALILAVLIVPEFMQRLPLVAALLPSRAEYVIYSSLSSMQNVARTPLQINAFNLLEEVYLRLHVIGLIQVVVVAGMTLLWRARTMRKGT